PTWTVAQIKSALMLTGDAIYASEAKTTLASPLSSGGGRIDVARASTPLIFASPSSASFGLLKPRSRKTISIALADAGGGAGTWTVSLYHAQGQKPTVPTSVGVPGTLAITATVATGAREGDGMGWIALQRGSDIRRIPYWLHVERP